MRLRRSAVPFLLAAWVAILATVLVVPAHAQEDPAGDEEANDRNALAIRAVDGRDPDAVEVEFVFNGPRQTIGDLVIREDGDIVEHTDPVLLADESVFGIVLAIDTSASMAENGAFERAKDAAVAFVENKAATDQIAIVTFGDDVEIAQRFTDETESLLRAIDDMGVNGFTALNDAVLEAVNLFEGEDIVRNLLLVTDGRDTASVTTPEVAAGRLDDTNTLLYAIGIESDDLDTGALDALALPTGGDVLTTATPTDLTDLYAEVQERFRRQYRTTFVSQVSRTGPIPLDVTVGTTTANGSFPVGARIESTVGVREIENPKPFGIDALQGSLFLWLALVLVAACAGGAAFALGSTFLGGRRSLETALRPYSDGFVAEREDEGGLATSAILKRAVELTGGIAERRGLLTRVEDALERANLPLRAAEAIFFGAVAALLLGVLVFIGTGQLLLGLVGIVIGVLLPIAVVNLLAAKRRKDFNAQLPDMLQLLASTLRAGYSLMQGVEAAAHEVQEPMRRELRRVVTESQLGMPLEEALENSAMRMNSKDFEWAVMAIGIQRDVGGNLAELLDTVADTMTQRERLRREINALTAEGRISAIVLGILPIGVGVAILVLNPGYMEVMFDRTVGTIMLIGGAGLMLAGFYWMYRLIQIEV